MRRRGAILGSLSFLILAPGAAAGLVPWWISRWRFQEPLLGLGATRLLGAALVVAGIAGLLDSFARFAVSGLGTPAPVAPPRHLVVNGLYQYVRNPMYVTLVLLVLGQSLLLGDVRLLGYGALLWLAFHAFVVGYEEPTLRRTFGSEYEDFLVAVPRWIPRLRPWRPGGAA